MVEVYFATNRSADPTRPNGFGAGIVAEDAAAITYAVADVAVDLTGSPSGTIKAIADRSMGRFSDAATAAIAGAGRNLFVFIHGFDNTFEDAITRAAINAEWYRTSGEPAADTVVLAFTWPSRGELISLGLDLPDAAYKADQRMAAASGFHCGRFLTEVDRIRQACQAPNPNARVFLLAHSMGNWVLQSAMTWWYQQHQPADDMFAEIILAAADEVADTFAAPNGTRLSHLCDVGRRINIYYSSNDAVIWLSTAINGNARLGHDGPTGKTDPARFPPDLFRMIDCTTVRDFFPPVLSEATHQYYRLSQTVRADIVAAMARTARPPGGLTALPAPAVGA